MTCRFVCLFGNFCIQKTFWRVIPQFLIIFVPSRITCRSVRFFRALCSFLLLFFLSSVTPQFLVVFCSRRALTQMWVLPRKNRSLNWRCTSRALHSWLNRAIRHRILLRTQVVCVCVRAWHSDVDTVNYGVFLTREKAEFVSTNSCWLTLKTRMDSVDETICLDSICPQNPVHFSPFTGWVVGGTWETFQQEQFHWGITLTNTDAVLTWLEWPEFFNSDAAAVQ